MFRSIRLKIFAGMLALSVIFVLISLAIMNAFLGRIVDEEIGTSLSKSLRSFETYSELRDQLLSRQANSFAAAPYLKATMEIQDVDHETLLFTAEELRKGAGTELLLLADPRGRLLADAGHPSASGDSLEALPGMTEALAGGAGVGAWRYRDVLYRAAIAPIAAGDRNLGFLILGRRIAAPDSIRRVKEATGASVVVLDEGRVLAESRQQSSAGEISAEEIANLSAAAATRREPAPGPRAALSAVIGGRPSRFEAVPLPGSGAHLILFRTLDDIADKVEPVRRVIYLAGGVCGVLAIFFSIWLSHRVTEPLMRLKTAVEQFGRGARDERVDIRSADEIGALGRAFNEMAEDLSRTTVSRDYFDNILRSMRDALIVVSPDGRIVLVNLAVSALLNRKETEILGSPFGTIMPEFGDGSGSNCDAWFRERTGKPHESHFSSGGDEKIPVAFSTSVLTDPTGAVSGYICVARDIREFLKLQAEKLQAEKMATMGSMAAIMAHELKNRLAVIAGASGLISMMVESGDAEEKELAEVHAQLDSELARATRLINDVLTCARPKKPAPEVFAARDLIGRLLARKEELLSDRKIRISTEKVPAEAKGFADPLQIEEAMEKLLLNAIEAQPGGGLIEFSADFSASISSRLIMRIRDEGVGMTPDTLARLFEPFFTTKEFGTGLGLGGARSLVEENGGKLVVTSEEGKGAVAIIELPGNG